MSAHFAAIGTTLSVTNPMTPVSRAARYPATTPVAAVTAWKPHVRMSAAM